MLLEIKCIKEREVGENNDIAMDIDSILVRKKNNKIVPLFLSAPN